jgi:hypothetical protein
LKGPAVNICVKVLLKATNYFGLKEGSKEKGKMP